MDEIIISVRKLFFLQNGCIGGIVLLMILWYWHESFLKRHPEALKPDCNPKIKRKHRNIVAFIFSFSFWWVAFIIAGIQYFSKEFSIIPVIVPLLIWGILLRKIMKKN